MQGERGLVGRLPVGEQVKPLPARCAAGGADRGEDCGASVAPAVAGHAGELTHKFDISGHEGYITVGLFEDSTPGEVFITMAKQGSTMGG